MNVAYRMSVQEYEELTPYAGDLVENWGKAPGHLNSDGQNLLVFGCKFGNVFIGVQPTFGYEVCNVLTMRKIRESAHLSVSEGVNEAGDDFF